MPIRIGYAVQSPEQEEGEEASARLFASNPSHLAFNKFLTSCLAITATWSSSVSVLFFSAALRKTAGKVTGIIRAV